MKKVGAAIRGSGGLKYTKMHKDCLESVPEIYALLTDDDDFIALRVYRKQDGVFMGVLKGYGPDGGERVAFGSGHDYFSCVLALEGAVTANHWRAEVPWENRKK